MEKKPNRLKRLKISYIKASNVVPNTYNPNRQSAHDFWVLCKSICEDGFTQPVIVQSKTGTIVNGEHRWTAWIVLHVLEMKHGVDNAGEILDQENGKEICADIRDNRVKWLPSLPDLVIPVVKVNMNAAQAMISTMRHNRGVGSEDMELAAAVLRELQELDALSWAQDSLCMSDDDLALLLDDAVPDALTGEFADEWLPSAEHEAAEESRQRDKALKAAKAEEARHAADANVFRLVLVYSGADADVAREVLGKDGAETVLEFCREEYASSV